MRILIVEDDKDLAESLKEILRRDFVVDLASDGSDGTYQAQINQYDLIVVDLGLPDISGIEVCKMIRTAKVQTPIIVLTAKTDVGLKVSSLDSGADDYITKPFSVEELKARIRAVLRRNPNTLGPEKIRSNDIVLNLRDKTVSRKGRTINLTRKEFELIESLMRHPNKVISKEALLESIWEKSLDVESNTVDVHISSLRRKVDKPFRKKLIKTVYGMGYKFVP